MMNKMMMGCAIAAMAVLGASVARAQDKKVTVAVSIPAADHGWTGGVVFQAERAKAMLEARYPDLKIIVKTSPDGASQANALEDLTTQGIDALVTLPHNSDELTDPIRQVKSKGVFVTVVDRALADSSIQDLYVAGNNPDLGRVAGEYIKGKLPQGNVVVIRGLPIVIDDERQKGFDTAVAGSGIKVLDKQFGNWSRDDAFKVMQDYLSKFPKIDAVWCQDDDMAMGVLEAVKQSGRKDIQFVVGGAGMKEMIDRVSKGDSMIPVDVLYPPAMIATAMELTVSNFYDQVPVRGRYILDATLVTKQNAKEFFYPDSPF